MALFLDKGGLDLVWNYLNEYVTFYGVCDTGATSTYKRVDVNGMTNLVPGVRLLVKFLNENTAGDKNNSVYLAVYTRQGDNVTASSAIVTDEYGNALGAERAHWLRGYCEFVYSSFKDANNTETVCWALVSSPSKDIIYVPSTTIVSGNSPAGREGMILLKEKEVIPEVTQQE